MMLRGHNLTATVRAAHLGERRGCAVVSFELSACPNKPVFISGPQLTGVNGIARHQATQQSADYSRLQ